MLASNCHPLDLCLLSSHQRLSDYFIIHGFKVYQVVVTGLRADNVKIDPFPQSAHSLRQR
jgi:hypothetical protein